MDKKKFLSQFYIYELKILAKYYKYIGKKPKEREKLLYDFCEDNIEGYSKVKYFKSIDLALNYAKKKTNNLIIIENIPITIKELEYIDNLELDHEYKKLLFTLLIKTKLNKEVCRINFGEASEYNYFGGNKSLYKEVYEMAKLPSKIKINEAINVLYKHGLVEIKARSRINLIFIDEIEKGDEIAFLLEHYQDTGYYYDNHVRDEKIIKCECNRYIRATNNRKKYCDTCAKRTEKEKWAERKRKQREKEKCHEIEKRL